MSQDLMVELYSTPNQPSHRILHQHSDSGEAIKVIRMNRVSVKRRMSLEHSIDICYTMRFYYLDRQKSIPATLQSILEPNSPSENHWLIYHLHPS